MNKTVKIVIVVALIAIVGIVMALKQSTTSQRAQQTPSTNSVAGKQEQNKNVEEAKTSSKQTLALPKLIDLGAGKCIPCKMMIPILDELEKEYAGRLKVEFIDVWENPDMAKKYKIRVIPTQIFFDASGKELFRHEGFFPKKDILSKWKELGMELDRTK